MESKFTVVLTEVERDVVVDHVRAAARSKSSLGDYHAAAALKDRADAMARQTPDVQAAS